MVYVPQKLWNCLLTTFSSSILSLFFRISVINESLFQQEMRFSFPLLLFIHRSPLSSFSLCFASSLHPHLQSCFALPLVLFSTFRCWFVSLFFFFFSRLRPEWEPPGTSDPQLIPHRWKRAQPSTFTVAPRWVFLQSTTGYFLPQKTPVFNSSNKLQRNTNLAHLDKYLLRNFSH